MASRKTLSTCQRGIYACSAHPEQRGIYQFCASQKPPSVRRISGCTPRSDHEPKKGGLFYSHHQRAHAPPSPPTTLTKDRMPTVKLVVVGSSGVGKTSLRGKYISGRFSNGYRATIGADFITKILPHPTDPEQTITLQIWDTAGQERFSSLSTAFFRGADAALLMFDVNAPETMEALKKWWGDFCDKAPVADVDLAEYCCVVVGNKIDMVGDGRTSVSESEALEFLDELVPSSSSSPPSTINVLPPVSANGHLDVLASEENAEFTPSWRPSAETADPGRPRTPQSSSMSTVSLQPTRSTSIAIAPQRSNHSREPSHSPKHHLSKSRSRSASRFYSGTMTTTHTTLTIYHTPSSSLFDVYQSARSSPEPWSRSEGDLSIGASPQGSVRRRRMTVLSTGSTSSGSAPTITPSLFARENVKRTEATTPPSSSPQLPSSAPSTIPLPPERGPKLFFTSAKTGEGVTDVFEYLARRVVRKWEHDEWVESRRMHFREASSAAETIRLHSPSKTTKWSQCCS